MPHTHSTYTTTAKALHWLVGLLMMVVFALGFYMADLPFSPAKLQYYSWHKWAGITVLVLAVVRLAWRLTHQPPALPAQMPLWQQWLAHAGHAVLYGMMLAIPLSGWLMSSAKGFQTVWFGVLPLPDLVAADAELGKTLATLHAWLNWGFVAVLASHIGAALKHHFIDRDDILTRMLPHSTQGR